MFRQLKGKALQACGQNLPAVEFIGQDMVIPFVGGTVETHEARKHPLPGPCRAYDLAEQTFGNLDDY